jgi:hypothetical protein
LEEMTTTKQHFCEAPHKNSEELVKMALDANNESTKFKFLKAWDLPEHPEYFYFRSDHLPYAKAGIRALFFHQCSAFSVSHATR